MRSTSFKPYCFTGCKAGDSRRQLWAIKPLDLNGIGASRLISAALPLAELQLLAPAEHEGGEPMLHENRVWCVIDVDSAESLAWKLTDHVWCCCTAFRIGEYYWLNDATSQDGAQEYAVVKKTASHEFIQLESITFSWCDSERVQQFIEQTVRGEFDTSDWCRSVKPLIESPDQHGRCQHCA